MVVGLLILHPSTPVIPLAPAFLQAAEKPFPASQQLASGLSASGWTLSAAPISESSEPVNRLFPQACVSRWSFPRAFTTHTFRAFTTHLHIVRTSSSSDDECGNQPDHRRENPTGWACAKERFHNDPPPDEFSRAWVLRNYVEVSI